MSVYDPVSSQTSVFSIGLVKAAALVTLVILLRHDLQLPAALVLFALFVAEGARWWSRAGLRNLQARYQINRLRFFPGDEAKLTMEIHNGKFLPVILDWSLSINQGLKAKEADQVQGEIKNSLAGGGFLKWHASLTTEVVLRAEQRGYYRLPPVLVSSRDGLGIYSHQASLDKEKWVVVYPRLLPLSELGFLPADLIGDRPDRRYILPDPIKVAGLREYTPDTPSRLIHWKASAHKNRLLAKVLEPSSSLILCLAVDAAAISQEPSPTETFETALSVVASLTCWADSQKLPFGLLVNASRAGLPGPVSIPVSREPARAPLVLESLARLELNPLLPLAELLRKESSHLPWGTTLVIVGPAEKTYAFPPVARRVVLYRYKEKDIRPQSPGKFYYAPRSRNQRK